MNRATDLSFTIDAKPFGRIVVEPWADCVDLSNHDEVKVIYAGLNSENLAEILVDEETIVLYAPAGCTIRIYVDGKFIVTASSEIESV